MKRKFAQLSPKEQLRIEKAYHAMKPEAFDNKMTTATLHSPQAIRLPKRMVTRLKAVAKLEGAAEYQTMVRTWIEDRLRQESQLAR